MHIFFFNPGCFRKSFPRGKLSPGAPPTGGCIGVTQSCGISCGIWDTQMKLLYCITEIPYIVIRLLFWNGI